MATSILLTLSLGVFSLVLIILLVKQVVKNREIERSYVTLRTFVANMSFKTSIDLIKYVSESFYSMSQEDVYVTYRNIYMPQGFVQLYKNGRFLGQVTEATVRNDYPDYQVISINQSVSVLARNPGFLKDVVVLLDVLFNAAMNYDELYSRSGIDTLTELHNRLATKAYKDEVYPFLVKNGRVSFIMFDVDKFKNFNDTYGHEVGDIVLKRVANAVMNNVKKSDFAFRFGGDEVGVIIKGTKDVAVEIAERIRDELKKHKDYHITLSIGIAESFRNESFDHLQGRADEALYYSKKKGRDTISTAEVLQ